MTIFCVLLLCAAWDGPITVSNDSGSGSNHLTFQEDLRFGGGADADDNEIWLDGQVSANFDVNSKGEFFIMDVKNATIHHFDAKGSFIATIATKGQGPGEFINPGSVNVLTNDQIVVVDNLGAVTKFNYFDAKGAFLEVKTNQDLAKILFLPEFSPDGSKLLSGMINYNQAENKMTFSTALMDNNFEVLEKFTTIPWPTPSAPRLEDPIWWEDMISEQLKGILGRAVTFGRFLPNNDLVIVNGTQYEIGRWTPDAKTQLLKVTREYKPVPFSEAEKSALGEWLAETVFEQFPQASSIVTANVMKRAVAKAELPDVMNPIIDVIAMENQGFATVHQASYRTGKVSGHIFDAKGKCIASYDFPGSGVYDLFGTRIKFANGYAYAMEQNEDRDNVMVRYKIKIGK